jgi:hypothetical protein
VSRCNLRAVLFACRNHLTFSLHLATTSTCGGTPCSSAALPGSEFSPGQTVAQSIALHFRNELVRLYNEQTEFYKEGGESKHTKSAITEYEKRRERVRALFAELEQLRKDDYLESVAADYLLSHPLAIRNGNYIKRSAAAGHAYSYRIYILPAEVSD